MACLATHLRQSSAHGGVPFKAVQELLGHASIELTMRYAHLSPDVKKDAVRVLEQHPRGTLGAHG
ncbi:tyrosine-type recombinase/integrase [Corallococcus terminator]